MRTASLCAWIKFWQLTATFDSVQKIVRDSREEGEKVIESSKIFPVLSQIKKL